MTLGRFLDQLAKIVTDPASNLTGAVILLAMVVLVLLILAVGALVTILPSGGGGGEKATAKPKASRKGPTRLQPKRASREHAPLFLLPLALVVGGLVWGWCVTSDPQRCASCHAVEPAYKTWAGGDHGEVACVACHEDGGVGLVTSAACRVSDLASSLRGLDKIDEATRLVPSYRCLRCHGEVEKGVQRVGTVKVSHREFLDKGYACERCHGEVGHSPASAPQRAVSMRQCVGCHDGKTASSACSTCHLGDPSTAVRVDRALFTKVDITPPPGCTGCHQTKTCLACHGIVMPHPPGFETAQGHARLAAFEKKDQVCYRCHVPQDCKRCHRGDFSAHGSDWKRMHPSGVPLDGRNACACHLTPNFCGLCHRTSKKT